MEKSGNFAEKWHATLGAFHKEEAFLEEDQEPQTGWQKAMAILRTVGRVLFRLRKVFMAIPVIYLAMKLGAYNMEHLPEMVGLNIQSNGSYAEMISRTAAVNGCLGVTYGCLALMFLSRKTVYPWIISFFSLILPIFLLLTNQYPC